MHGAGDHAALDEFFLDSAEELILPDTFLASSEEGFSMTEGGRCRIGSAVGSIELGGGR